MSTAPSGAATSATITTAHSSSVSSITADPSVTRVTRIENPARDAEFDAISLRAVGGTRNLLREHRPPNNEAGHEFCVAWWTRGGCFPNCDWRSAHTQFALRENVRGSSPMCATTCRLRRRQEGPPRGPDGEARVACHMHPGSSRLPHGSPTVATLRHRSLALLRLTTNAVPRQWQPQRRHNLVS